MAALGTAPPLMAVPLSAMLGRPSSLQGRWRERAIRFQQIRRPGSPLFQQDSSRRRPPIQQLSSSLHPLEPARIPTSSSKKDHRSLHHLQQVKGAGAAKALATASGALPQARQTARPALSRLQGATQAVLPRRRPYPAEKLASSDSRPLRGRGGALQWAAYLFQGEVELLTGGRRCDRMAACASPRPRAEPGRRLVG